MDEKLNLLMVITTLDVGGAERHLHLLCGGLKERGHRIEIVFLKGQGALAPDFEALGIPVEKIPFESPLGFPRAVRAVAAKLKQGAYQVVHSHLLKADLVAALACLTRDSGILVSSKHNDERALLNPAFSFVHGVISEKTDRVIALSDHVGRFVARHGRVDRGKITRIYYGIRPETFRGQTSAPEKVRAELGLEEGVPVMTMVARFAPQKDHATLLEAARLLKNEGRPFQLLLVGDDPFGGNRERMVSLCRALNLTDRVIFTGIRKDVPAILSVSALFVMPSLWEGLGLVFLEAMASSLPIVANRVSAIPEIVVHGETGLLVPPGDPEVLKSALLSLIDDPSRARRLGRAGKVRLEARFTLVKMVDETELVYRSCLNEIGADS